MATRESIAKPQATSLIGKASQIEDVLSDMDILLSNLDCDLYGAGSTGQDESNSSATLSGKLQDILSKACHLRTRLEGIRDGVNPPPFKQDAKVATLR